MSEEFNFAAKKALSLWSAKNNALIRKYERLLEIANQDEDKLYLLTPSPTRNACLDSIFRKKSCYRMFLDDLRKPCDTFISEFEFQNIGKEIG